MAIMPKSKESEMKNKGYAKFWGANTGPGGGGGGGVRTPEIKGGGMHVWN